VGDEHLVELGLDPCAGQTGQRVVAVRVLQVQALQTQVVGLGADELARGKVLSAPSGSFSGSSGWIQTVPRWEGYLD